MRRSPFSLPAKQFVRYLFSKFTHIGQVRRFGEAGHKSPYKGEFCQADSPTNTPADLARANTAAFSSVMFMRFNEKMFMELFPLVGNKLTGYDPSGSNAIATQDLPEEARAGVQDIRHHCVFGANQIEIVVGWSKQLILSMHVKCEWEHVYSTWDATTDPTLLDTTFHNFCTRESGHADTIQHMRNISHQRASTIKIPWPWINSLPFVNRNASMPH